jgi:capsular exopolysaccharide synthesis family protein
VDPIEYVRAVRRHWVLITSAVGIAIALAWITTSVAPVATRAPVRSYQATTVMLSSGGVNVGGVSNLKTLAAIASIPDISKRVAEDLHYTAGDPAALGSYVSATGDPETGLLKISAIWSEPTFAKNLADKFAAELLAFLRDRAQATNQAEVKALGKYIDQLKVQISRLDTRIDRAGNSTEAQILTAERDARITSLSSLSNQLQQLSADVGTPTGLLILQEAVPILMPTQSVFQPPRSRNSRLILGALVGLLGGVALTLVMERFDTRIRTKKAAERHFALPVLAEIPFIPKRKRRRLAAVVPWRKSREDVPVILPYFPRVSDSFRLLGAGISRAAPNARRAAGGPWTGRAGSRNGSGAVIMVTSPGPGEGKTTVTANLAMTFAQVGKKVMVMSCDFKRPHIHELFGVANTTGLVEALQSDSGLALLDGHIKQTPIRDVRLVPSGSHPRNTAALLSSERMHRALDEARREADIVLLDTAPLLASAEITHLFPYVDAVVVVARAKKTTAELAERASELLKRLDAPVVGVALNGAMEVPVPSSYYRYYTQPMSQPQMSHPEGNGPIGGAARPNGSESQAQDPRQMGDSPL